MKIARFLLVLPLLYAWISAAQVCRNPAAAERAAQMRGAEIPVTIRGGGIFVPIVLNDGQNYSFLLDSGFEDSVLDPATIRALHLKSEEMHTEAAPGGKVETSSVRGVHRIIGGVAIVNSTVSSLDLSGFARCSVNVWTVSLGTTSSSSS
ncbi:MAG TPA: aspartyl protease family protein [Candidatus Acidoferrales bacterium]|nr:aspartyl protease family protein [Candidatus Acidoferrales bacterium]